MSDAHNTGPGQLVIINENAAKWVVIVFLAFAVAYAVVGERTDHDTARDAQTEALILKSHVMEFQAKLDALEKLGQIPKENEHGR